MSVRSTARAFAGLIALALPSGAYAVEPEAVLTTYADIARAGYQDSLTSARTLGDAIDAFLASPSPEGQEAAKRAWLQARVPYQQTEVFRFGNPIVDDWEGKVNAWPLDEGLIDYVDPVYGTVSDENPWYAANVVANPNLEIGGETIDATTIDATLLQNLHEIDAVEANVTTGYHAIEFLLWGQDLNGTDPGRGERPWTDYAAGDACTNGHCDRRADYLRAAAELLIVDLEEIVRAWDEGGAARAALTDGGPAVGLSAILTGLGSLAYGELAGERTKLGLLLNDPEEEHDCFSDNTHNSHFYNVLGMQNVYLGRYERIDGSMIEGPSLAALVAETNPGDDAAMRERLEATLASAAAVKTAADSGQMAYDQMLDAENEAGQAMLQRLVDALVAQTEATEQIVADLGLGQIAFEGSDSLDAPEAVFQ